LIGVILTYGKYPVPDLDESKCILLWGHNPHQSGQPEMSRIFTAQKKGAKLIAIDPRSTFMAKKADMHIRIRPGTDGALLLSLLHVIVSEELYEKDFVTKWTYGFDKLEEHVRQFTPEWAEKIKGIRSHHQKDG
jgi:anaerobic selenocysteine-containing dehydrogenase